MHTHWQALNALPIPWTMALLQLFVGIPYCLFLWTTGLRKATPRTRHKPPLREHHSWHRRRRHRHRRRRRRYRRQNRRRTAAAVSPWRRALRLRTLSSDASLCPLEAPKLSADNVKTLIPVSLGHLGADA